MIESLRVGELAVEVHESRAALGARAGAAAAAAQRARPRASARVVFAAVRPGAVHLLHGAEDEATSYAARLAEAPVDVCCLGIGENGHLAFNDPPVADFEDPVLVKPVELDHACRVQQVNDGCFARLDDVPRRAVTLTIPALMAARTLICSVPGESKREAGLAGRTISRRRRCPGPPRPGAALGR
jgi:glucosamine-6-phosphate deaminase